MKGNISKNNLDALWLSFAQSCRRGKKSFRPRGAVIPYTTWNNREWYFFGIDNNFKSICDFGGGYSYNDGNLVRTAWREWEEESLGVFAPYVDSDVESYYYFDVYRPSNFHSSPHLVIFVKLKPVNPRFIRELFIEKILSTAEFVEVIDIIAIERYLLHESVKNIQTDKRYFIKKSDHTMYKMWDQLFWRLYAIIHTTDVFN